MRTKSAQVDAVIANPAHSARPIVTVYDAGGVARVLDAGTLGGIVDPVLRVEIKQDVDSPRTAEIVLMRQQGAWSLAPLVTTGNPLNALYGALAVPTRRVVVEVELALPDVTPASTPAGLSLVAFDGVIDEVAWGSDELTLTCTDKTANLRDTWIERERVYAWSAAADRGILLWANKDYAYLPALAVNDLVAPSEDKANGHFYRVTAITSTHLTAEPTWPTGTGATVVSGGTTFTEAGTLSLTGIAAETVIQQILNDNGLSAIVLSCPVSPGWLVKPYTQQRQSVLDALSAIVAQLGWFLRFEWNSGSSAFRLTMAEPSRLSSTVHKTLTQSDELEAEDLSLAAWDVRNVVRVIYGDSSSRDPGGSPTRIVREVSDATSIATYGRRFMEIAEADGSMIDTSTEADRLANAALADLKDPIMEGAIRFPIDPYLELGDRIQIPADGRRFSSDQTLAVHGFTHSIAADGATTSVTLRGRPAAMHAGWLSREGRVNPADVHRIVSLGSTATTIATSSVVGGQEFVIKKTRTKNGLLSGVEIHVSETANFTPSASTLRGSGHGETFTIGDLVPGKTYYTKAVSFARNASRILRAEPSAEVSFVAGRASSAHYDSRATQSHLPLNGNFEHFTEGEQGEPFTGYLTAPPDHWIVENYSTETGEAWGPSGSVFYGSDSTKGRYLELSANASTRGNVISSPFEVRRGNRAWTLYASIMRTGSSATTGKDLIVDVLGYQDSALTNLISNWSIVLSGSASGPYPTLSTWYDVALTSAGFGTIPANVNFLRVRFRRGTSGDSSFAWRVGDCYLQEADFAVATVDALTVNTSLSGSAVAGLFTPPAWTAPTLNTGWANVGGGNMSAGYFKDAFGVIHLRGLVIRSSGSAAVFQLPSGYRPSANLWFATPNNVSATTYVYVTTAGDVHMGNFASGAIATAGTMGLDGITFDTR